LDNAQVRAEPVVYDDGQAMCVKEIARGLGACGIIHHSYEITQKLLSDFDFRCSKKSVAQFD